MVAKFMPGFLFSFFCIVIGQAVDGYPERISREEGEMLLKARYPSFTFETWHWILREEILRAGLAYYCTRAMQRVRALGGVFPLDPVRDTMTGPPKEVLFADEVCACLEPIVSDVPILGQYIRFVRWYVPKQAFLLKRRTQRLCALSYDAYLRTPYWNVVRELAQWRAHHRCQLCNRPKHETSLHVHHRTYEHRGEETQYPLDLLVLCQPCHENFHFPEGPQGALRKVYH